MLINFRVTQVFHLNHRDVTANENSARLRAWLFQDGSDRGGSEGECLHGVCWWGRRNLIYAESYCLIQRNAASRLFFQRADMNLYCLPGREAEYSHRPPVLLITCNIKGPICRRNSFQCNSTSGCIHMGRFPAWLGFKQRRRRDKIHHGKAETPLTWRSATCEVSRFLHFWTDASVWFWAIWWLWTSKKTANISLLSKHFWLSPMCCFYLEKVHLVPQTQMLLHSSAAAQL